MVVEKKKINTSVCHVDETLRIFGRINIIVIYVYTELK